MKSIKLITFYLFAVMATFGHAQTPEHLQLFLLIGQSNMAGRGTVDPSEVPDPRIFTMDRTARWIPARDPLHFDKPKVAGVGPGLSFARALVKAEPSISVGLIPCAVGGTSMDQWAPGGPLYKNAVWRTKAAMKQGQLAGILWHQGETDAKKPELVAAYPPKFEAMIAQLRKDLGAENVPVILGELGRYLKMDASAEFNAGLPAIIAQVPLSTFVTSENLTDGGDHLHFDTASAHTLGERYAAAYLKLKSQSPKSTP